MAAVEGEKRRSKFSRFSLLLASRSLMSQLWEEGDVALFAVTKSRSCVYPINSTSGEIWEAPCCHLLSALNELHKPVHDFLLVYFFLSYIFFVIHFATLFVTAHSVQSSPMDRSSQATLCSGFCVVVFCVFWFSLACFCLLLPRHQAWASAANIYTSWHPETRRQSLISLLFSPALDDDTVLFETR